MQPVAYQPSTEARISRLHGEGRPVKNRILLELPDNEYQALCPYLGLVVLPQQTSLYQPGERLEFAYFPNSGLISLVVVTRERKTVEAGLVGSEGLLGTPAVLGLARSFVRAVVQIAGDGLRIRVEALYNLLPATPQLQLLASRQAMIQGMQAAQLAACNRLHRIEQRLARWLLMMQDHIESSSFFITHDQLAGMLGTDRPSVSLAAGILQRKGAIGYTRGVVNILSREKIEEAACECYGIMQQFSHAPLMK
jgi:CRP-like cAMP-binding protein